ncbi:DUF4058 family protein [Limnochorda pilosa]|uniref:DUF4058 domain-containing protein n=1 Tax=Limnochorda pilosa TaxID=1555112 RepID=A0A0K2SQ07_LIMPI|nr:DUF4058 family protein [Limnochorda pilosa]BAS29205.1 hypothetical protein LIP_3393 [Limnochorda pilosa]
MGAPGVRLDPRLETSGLWPDFHARFLVALADHLTPLLRPRYLTLVEERVYVAWEEAPSVAYRPDASVTRPHPPASAGQAHATSVPTAEPIPALLPFPEEVRERYLRVQTASGELVTVVELLSPNNKRPNHEGRAAYLRKREDLLAARVNLVEMDLLVNGERMPLVSPWPPGDRFVLVARGTAPGRGELYPIPLPDPLPVIRFPLRSPDADLPLDLQAILADVWVRGDYALKLDQLARGSP